MKIEIKRYSAEHYNDLVGLINELQDYLVDIDPIKRLRREAGYGENFVDKLLEKLDKQDGIIYLAYDGNNAVGVGTGIISETKGKDLLEWIPTKTGWVSDLVVSERARGKGIGKILMKRMEEYFEDQQCDVIRIRVMTNNPAYKFYKNMGYSDRIVDVVKEVG